MKGVNKMDEQSTQHRTEGGDPVNHPEHYQGSFETRTLECIDFTRHMPFSLGNAFKYVWRAGRKGGADKALQDLEKARWYLIEYDSSMLTLPAQDMEASLGVAQTLFMLLKAPVQTLRYITLSYIVSGDLSRAEEHVAKCINRLERGQTID